MPQSSGWSLKILQFKLDVTGLGGGVRFRLKLKQTYSHYSEIAGSCFACFTYFEDGNEAEKAERNEKEKKLICRETKL
jgi:hypothetical protein